MKTDDNDSAIHDVFPFGSLNGHMSIVCYVALLYGKLRERTRCSEFCVVIGYPKGQDEAILPAWNCSF